MLGCLQRALEVSGCQLHQLTLMTNHLHMIVTPPELTSLSTLMHRTNQRYAQQRNRLRNSTGKLFEERYRSDPIRDETHLMIVTLYNDANAFRARMVADAVGHEWSTGPLHAGGNGSRIPTEMWTPSPWYLGLGDGTVSRAGAYRRLMTSYLDTDPIALVDDDVERDDIAPYRLRLERPDGSSAHEPHARWGSKR